MIEVNNEKGIVVVAGQLDEILTDAARVLDAIAHKLSSEKKLDMTYDKVTEMLLEGQDAARKDREDGSVVDVMSENTKDQKKVSEILDRMKKDASETSGGISMKQLMKLKEAAEKDRKEEALDPSEKAAKKAKKAAKKAKKAAKKAQKAQQEESGELTEKDIHDSFVFRRPRTFKKESDAK